MNYNTLLDMATELGYYLAISGAETYRVEDSVGRILNAYGLTAEVFAIPNCLTVSIDTAEGEPMTRMRRVDYQNVDLDSVERFSNLSRRICAQKPKPEVAMEWLQEVAKSRVHHKLPMHLVGSFIGAAGFGWFFGADLLETLLAGICGIIVGLVNKAMNNLKVNSFFTTLLAAFLMSFFAYSVSAAGFLYSADAAIIGALMILVPGLLFTNAMRDIIFGDTNSGVNRIVQVILVAVAIAIGAGFSLNAATKLFGTPGVAETKIYADLITVLAAFIGCIMTATSVSITVQSLRELGYLKGRVGTTILSAAIIDDIIGIVVLTFVIGFKNPDANPLKVIVNTVLFFVAAIIGGVIAYHIFKKADNKYPHTRRIPIAGLALCFVLAYVAEEFFGIADITGAYVAGIVLCSIKDSHYIEEKVDINSYMLFGPVFFASIGLKTSIDNIDSSLMLFCIAFVIVALISKIIGCGLLSRICGFKGYDCLKIGVGMMTRGEVALIVAQKGLSVGLMSAEYFTAVILLIIISSISVPIILKLLYTKAPEMV